MPRGRPVHSGSRGIIRARIVVVGFIWVRVGSLRRDRGRPVHSGSRVFTPGRLGVVGFIRVCGGSRGRA